MIHKSAAKIGTIEFANGKRNALFVGSNSNTGETILWQQVQGRRAQRVTGRNIANLVAELVECLRTGEAKWIGEFNAAALAAIGG